MLNQEETANIVTLLDDLEIDLRNGNVPAAKLLIVSIVNCLLVKQPLEWKFLGDFISDHLDDTGARLALMRVLPDLKMLICPIQPDQEADTEC